MDKKLRQCNIVVGINQPRTSETMQGLIRHSQYSMFNDILSKPESKNTENVIHHPIIKCFSIVARYE
jgi:hypothetical protein